MAALGKQYCYQGMMDISTSKAHCVESNQITTTSRNDLLTPSHSEHMRAVGGARAEKPLRRGMPSLPSVRGDRERTFISTSLILSFLTKSTFLPRAQSFKEISRREHWVAKFFQTTAFIRVSKHLILVVASDFAAGISSKLIQVFSLVLSFFKKHIA